MKQPEPKRRWFILIQQRSGFNYQFSRNDWRGYRKFSVWPITFDTLDQGQEFMAKCFTFKGINGRKLSASVVDRPPRR